MIKAIKPKDPHFVINDGFIVANRAGIEISNRCPKNYISLIQECISHGWINPVAHVTAEEYMVMKLSN